LIVAVSQRLVADQPESLKQKCQQKACRDALREIEAKASKDSEPVGHHNRRDSISLNGANGGSEVESLRRHCVDMEMA
jgi:hypothetical protein